MQLPEKNSHSKMNKVPWLKAGIIVAVVSYLLFLMLGSAITAFIEKQPFYQRYILSRERDSHIYMERGAGQFIGKSKTAGGVTITLHRLVSDLYETKILFSASADRRADKGLFEVSVLNEDGAAMPGGHAYRFNEDLGKITGYVSTDGFDKMGDKIVVSFTRAYLTKSYELEVSFDLEDDLLPVLPLYDAAGEEIGSFSIASAALEGDVLTLDIEWDLPGYESSNPLLTWFLQDGSELSNGGSIYSASSGVIKYQVIPDKALQFSMHLSIDAAVAGFDTPLLFEIAVDPEKAGTVVFREALDEKIAIDHNFLLNLNALVSTAGQTLVEYEVDFPGGRPDNLVGWSIALQSGERRIPVHPFTEDDLTADNVEFKIALDPTISRRDLTFLFEGRYLLEDRPVEVSLKRDDIGKSYPIAGSSIVVEAVSFYVDIDEDELEHILALSGHAGRVVQLTLSSPSVLLDYDCLVTDSAGTRDVLSAYSYRVAGEENSFRTVILFVSNDYHWTIRADSYRVFDHNRFELDLS